MEKIDDDNNKGVVIRPRICSLVLQIAKRRLARERDRKPERKKKERTEEVFFKAMGPYPKRTYARTSQRTDL